MINREDLKDWYDEEPMSEDFFDSIIDDTPPTPLSVQKQELSKVGEYRLYCFPRIGMLRLGRELVIESPETSAVLSITSTTDICPSLSELGFLKPEDEGAALRLKFDDIGPRENGSVGIPAAMTRKQAEKIVGWIEDMIASGRVNFYIHCDAGVSRSQAVIQFILDCYPDLPWVINPYNPPSCPNAYVLAELKRIIWERSLIDEDK